MVGHISDREGNLVPTTTSRPRVEAGSSHGMDDCDTDISGVKRALAGIDEAYPPLVV
jgi:hypothetical protein